MNITVGYKVSAKQTEFLDTMMNNIEINNTKRSTAL